MLVMINLLTLLLVILALFLFKKRVDRIMNSHQWLEKVRDEVDDLTLEINKTSEQSVLLLENKIKHLNTLLERADKKILILEKELEQKNNTPELYSHLKPSNGSSPLIIEIDKGLTGQFKGSHKGSKDNKQEGASQMVFDLVEDPAPKEVFPPVQESLKDKVLKLYSEGFSPEIISHKLGSTISEIELIISLTTEKRL